MSNSVLRRYTPPTCTLEIAAKGSPLSRWTDRLVLKQLRFQLSFDDPKLSPEQQVRLRGDRAQLEALCEVVAQYVREFLVQPPAYGDGAALRQGSDNGTIPHSFHIPVPVLAGSSNGNGDGSTLLQNPFELHQSQDGVNEANAPVRNANSSGIELKPQGLLAHNLYLGDLATEESGPSVRLSTVQLFDLANALDEYSADALTLPALERSSWLKSSQSWLKIAAVAVLALGVTGTLAKFVIDVSAPPLQTASSTSPENSEAQQSIAIAPDPAAVPITPGEEFAAPTPLNLETLPPPPPPGTTTPAPNSGLPSVNVPQSAPQAGNAPQAATRPLPPAATTPPAPNLPQQVLIPTQPIPPLSARSAEGSTAVTEDRGATQAGGSSEGESAPLAGSQPSADAATRPGTAFDTIPQVAEARDYFQASWQPPEGLTQTLEYRLTVGADGTIQRIIPLGQAAGSYVDRTQIPLVGDPFVSPLESGQRAEIRLVLSPDGKVRTFLESLN